MNVERNVCSMRIAIGTLPREPQLITDVVYWRCNLSPDYVVRWRWYLEYLAARIKVAHPRMKVEVSCGRQGEEFSKEWHEMKRQNLIRSTKAAISKLEREGFTDDLFGFNREEYEKKHRNLSQKMAQLEADTYPLPVWETYINKVKQYI